MHHATCDTTGVIVNSKGCSVMIFEIQHCVIGSILATRPSVESGDDGNGRSEKAGGTRHVNGKQDNGAGSWDKHHTCASSLAKRRSCGSQWVTTHECQVRASTCVCHTCTTHEMGAHVGDPTHGQPAT